MGDYDYAWSLETRYAELLQNEEVRALILTAANSAADDPTPGIAYLNALESVAMLATPAPLVPMKRKSQTTQRPIGESIVAILCHLAASRFDLECVAQREGGCLFEAMLPSGSHVVVSMLRSADGTDVDAGIKGSVGVFDFGKSERILTNLLASLRGRLGT